MGTRKPPGHAGGPPIRRNDRVKVAPRDHIETPAELIDRICATVNGEKILAAYALIAWGEPEHVARFFPNSVVRINTRHRLEALRRLEERRFGRVPNTEELGAPATNPVTIVNVFTDSPAYAHVHDAPSTLVGSGATKAVTNGRAK